MKTAVMAFVMAMALVPAQAGQKQIGTWLVSSEKDRFGSGDTVIALTVDGQAALGLRCISGDLTFAHIDPVHQLTAGAPFLVLFKGGNHDVVTTFGDAVNDKMIEIAVTNDMRSQLLTSDEFAFRFTGKGLQFDVAFPAGTARAALPQVIKACPVKADADN